MTKYIQNQSDKSKKILGKLISHFEMGWSQKIYRDPLTNTYNLYMLRLLKSIDEDIQMMTSNTIYIGFTVVTTSCMLRCPDFIWSK